MFVLLIISLLFNVGFFTFCCFLRSEVMSLTKENARIKKRKVQASDELIFTFEQAMINAIQEGNIEEYKEYLRMYNDLIPEKSIDVIGSV